MKKNNSEISIIINGKDSSAPNNSTIRNLLKILNINNESIAVAVNQDVIPKAHYDSYVIQNNSSIEIISAVGGG